MCLRKNWPCNEFSEIAGKRFSYYFEFNNFACLRRKLAKKKKLREMVAKHCIFLLLIFVFQFRVFRLFQMSLCNEPLRELSNPGASGSLFFLTNDDEFIIKTVQHKEAEFLQKLLPGYYMNLNQNPHTLLPKFFGMFCYQCNQKNIRLIVMNNLLPSSIKMHLRFDLKGSTYKRKANKRERAKTSPCYKDLDFRDEVLPEGLSLEPETYNALITTMRRDCRVLESFRIMDYSLLIGIHNLDQAAREDNNVSSILLIINPSIPSSSTTNRINLFSGGSCRGSWCGFESQSYQKGPRKGQQAN